MQAGYPRHLQLKLACCMHRIYANDVFENLILINHLFVIAI